MGWLPNTDSAFIRHCSCHDRRRDPILTFPTSYRPVRWKTGRHGSADMDRPSPPPRTDGRSPAQDDAARNKWSSTESLPFAIAPSVGNGSFNGRQGVQGERVSPAFALVKCPLMQISAGLGFSDPRATIFQPRIGRRTGISSVSEPGQRNRPRNQQQIPFWADCRNEL